MSNSTEFVISTGSKLNLEWSITENAPINLTIYPKSQNKGYLWTWDCHNGELTFRLRYPPKDTKSLKEKVKRDWQERIVYVSKHAKSWSRDPISSFFGIGGFASSEEWSCQSLIKSEDKGQPNRERNIFHKLNLAEYLRQQTENKNTTGADVKRNLLAAREPQPPGGFRWERPEWQKLNKHIRQGQSLWSLWKLSPGLVIILGPIMSRDELDAVSKESFNSPNLPWLNATELHEARKYDQLAETIIQSMKTTQSIAGSFKRKFDGQDRGLLSLKRHKNWITTEMKTIPSDYLPNSITPDARYLLLLFSSLGGSSIPSFLLQRGQCPQSRWTDSGCEHKVAPSEAGLDLLLAEILADSNRVGLALKQLSPFLEDTIESAQTYSLQDPCQVSLWTQLTEKEKEEWSIKAIKLVCFVFPREQIWELDYTSVGGRLQPLLIRTVENLMQADIVLSLRIEIARALLAASNIGNIASRQNVVQLAITMLGKHKPNDLQIEITLQESILSRLLGDYKRSEDIINNFCRPVTEQPDMDSSAIQQFYRNLRTSGKLHALYGSLHVSHLQNLVQTEKYATAIDEVDDWIPSKPQASIMELNVLPRKSIVVSNILRYQGRFEEARDKLEHCLGIIQPYDRIRYQFLCNLADTYCDLGLPSKADKLLVEEIENVRRTPTRAKQLRRLLVSTIETQIQQGHYESAKSTTRELDAIFSSLVMVDISDEMLHIRALLGSARAYHHTLDLSGALKRWNDALLYLQRYKSFEARGFVYAVIQLSLSLLYLDLGRNAEAEKAFNGAASILGTGIKDHWIPGLDRWRQSVEQDIQSRTQWTIRYTKI